MTTGEPSSKSRYGRIKSVNDLGQLIRAFRKQRHLTLEKVTGLSNVSMRFLSELERGKETAELGKTIEVLNKLGLEIIIRPRGGHSKELNDD